MLRIIAGALALVCLLVSSAEARHKRHHRTPVACNIVTGGGQFLIPGPCAKRLMAVRRDTPRRHYAARWKPSRHGYVRQPPARTNAQRIASAAVQGAVRGGQTAVEYSRPRDCYGIAWCGCWLRHVLGIPDRSLNLAINWARVGSPASPESANVVVWRHHVGKLLAHEGNRILIQSGNDRGAVRTRWVSPGILGGVVAYRRV